MTTDPRLLVSTGDLFEWLWPATFAASALASAWLLARLLRRGLPLYAALPCALAALFFPLSLLPLFLALLLLLPPRNESRPAESESKPDQDEDQTGEASNATPDAPTRRDEVASEQRRFHRPAARRALALSYAALSLSLGALYFYRDQHTADAHLARAANAKLRNRPARAVEEYEAALRLSDDPHTRKLLALELSAAGRHQEALTHLRAARAAGEPDELLAFHTASALDALSRPDEAAAEYRTFLEGSLCRQEAPDPRCATAHTRLRDARTNPAR